MDNFLFALNATLPVFLLILLGWFLKKIRMLNDAFCKVGNQYVFSCALPVSLFLSVSSMDIRKDFDPVFCLFCFLTTTIMFLGAWWITWKAMKKREQVGAFAQASVRSSAAILGVAFAINIYGNSGMVPIMIASAVPFFNIYSVLILTFSPHVDDEGKLISASSNGGSAVKQACIGVLKNPIIIAVILGILASMIHLQLPTILNSAFSMVGNTASPIALLIIGASFSGSAALEKWKPAALSTAIKLFLLPALFLPVAILLGFRETAIVAILIMLGSPTTVTSYVMARSMKADSVLASNAVVLSTLVSSVSITFWLYILKSLNLV